MRRERDSTHGFGFMKFMKVMKAPLVSGLLALSLILPGCTAMAAVAPAQQSSAGTFRTSAADEALLDSLEATTFRYFVEQSSPRTGMTRDRSTAKSPASIAAVGFSLSAHVVAAERGYIPRAEAIAYTRKTLQFLWSAPQGAQESGVAGYKGLFYHFIDMETGARAWKCELSTIDTALLMAGVLMAGNYYGDKDLHDLADKLYRRVDWAWATDGQPRVSLGWHPETGFLPYHWGGYNEGMILLLLGLGSPTYPLKDNAWGEWAKTYQQGTSPIGPYMRFGPLFGHQYSHTWVDFRGVKDVPMQALGIDYFENSRRATLAQQAYAVANPKGFKGYGALDWGLTACDGPGDKTLPIDGKPRTFIGYSARGIDGDPDDGTLAPTAALGSMPFAPEIVMPTLRHWRKTRPEIWGRYGFTDASNPTHPGTTASGWVDTDTLGIDQGPILLMAENYRSGLLWKTMAKDPYLTAGMRRAGFQGGRLGAAPVAATQVR